MVFYRKYRPQKIDDLDNTVVREKLSAVLKNSTTHAFLFTGPKGLGKTSSARIIAKAVNCTGRNQESRIKNQDDKEAKSSKNHDSSFIIHDSNSIEPCGKCEQCVSITNGTNLDVLEIDAASNRGIDEIRDLKEKIRLAPSSSKVKVYIIDEVHMLTTEAFNALLKTLEEPPVHAMFILCTTEPHKVPATIVSRCMHINFSPATDDEIVRSLKRVVAGEELNIDDEVLYAIAGVAEGGFRDATKILEELALISSEEKISKDVFEKSYKTANILFYVTDLLKALKDKNIKLSLETIKQITVQGIDMKFFLQQILFELHKKLLREVGVETSSENLKFEINEIKYLVELFSKASQDMKYAVVPQLPLELAIIEYCQKNIEQKIEEKKEIQKQVEDENNGVTLSSLRKQVGEMKKEQVLYGTTPVKKDESSEPTIETSTIELMHAAPNGDATKEWLEHFWNQLILEMRRHNHTIAGVLRGCSIKSYDKKTLVIQTSYKFHKERLDNAKTQQALVDICKLLTGKDMQVVVELRNN